MKNFYKIILVCAVFFPAILQAGDATECTTVDECVEQAKKGDKDAQMKLGYMYSRGSSALPYNLEETVKWYIKAGENGQIYAQHNLGAMYYEGAAVAQDHKKSFNWYEMAAKQGYANSQYDLVISHKDKHPIQSYAWSYVMLHDDDEGFRQHGRELIDEMKAKLTPEELEHAEELADEYLMLYGKNKK